MRSDYNIVSPAERLANGVVQSVNVVLAVTGCVALGVLVGTQADPMQLAALAVYGTGLLAMVGASALYAWGRAGRRHTLYRHLDHAAILVMIAGTYTPFIVISFGGMQGRRLLALVWAVALVGIVGVDEEYGLIHHGCGGSVLSVCISRASHEINMTAFRERHFRPAETAEGPLTEANWVRLKKLVEKARFWEMPERHDQSGLDGLIGR